MGATSRLKVTGPRRVDADWVETSRLPSVFFPGSTVPTPAMSARPSTIPATGAQIILRCAAGPAACDGPAFACGSVIESGAGGRSVFSVLFLWRARFRLMLATGWGEIQISAHPSDILRTDSGAFKNKWLKQIDCQTIPNIFPNPLPPKRGIVKKCFARKL